MVGWRNNHLGVIANQRAFDLHAPRRAAHDRHVQPAALEGGNGVFAVADDQFDVDARMTAGESREHLWCEIFGGGDDADRHPPAGQRFEPGETGPAIGKHRLDPLGCRQHLLAGGREP
jgi:hypothetical protein